MSNYPTMCDIYSFDVEAIIEDSQHLQGSIEMGDFDNGLPKVALCWFFCMRTEKWNFRNLGLLDLIYTTVW